MKKYKYAEIYKGAPAGEKPTLNDWYVYYYFIDPKTEKWRRFILKDGINRLETISERLDKAKNMVRTIDMELDQGFNPFSEVEDRPAFSIENGIKWALTKKKWSKETMDIHKGTISTFYKAINPKSDIKKFTRIAAREALDKMCELNGVGDKSWNRWRTTLHGIFAELAEWEKIPFNPFQFKNRKVQEREEPNLATPQQAKLIREHLLIHCPGLYVFLLMENMTTIRPSEILKIKAENFEIFDYTDKGETREMWYIKIFSKDVKDRTARKVVVPIHLRQFLKSHIIPGHYLFGDQCQPQVRKTPKSYKAVYKYWTKWVVEDLGITNIKPYSFKHLGVKSMLAIMSDKAVQYQAGHSTSSMTDIYSNKDATIFKDDLEKFEGNL